MAEFELAIPTIFLHEGRYVDHPHDPGGATSWGISLSFLRSTGDLDKDGWPDGDVNRDGETNVEDIKMLTKERAKELYKLYFWDKYRYANIIDQSIATKVFDLAVNMGAVGAHKVLQRAIRAAIGVKVDDDGVFGFKTLHGSNLANPIKLLPALKSEAAGYYRSIRLKNGGEKSFIEGWLNRSYSDCVIEIEKCAS